MVSGATADPDFAHLPVVTGAPEICFYAGHPLRSAGGHPVGTLCVMDTVPRPFTDTERDLLVELAGVAERELNQQRELDQAGRIQQMLMLVPHLGSYSEWPMLRRLRARGAPMATGAALEVFKVLEDFTGPLITYRPDPHMLATAEDLPDLLGIVADRNDWLRHWVRSHGADHLGGDIL